MNKGKYVFSQLTEFIPWYTFSKIVEKYGGNYKVRKLLCSEQLLAMIFGQLTHRESLRDLINCLQSQTNKLYHLGFKSSIYLSTLAKANENRDYRIYEELANTLIVEARNLYNKDENFPFNNLEGNVYILDSTVIELCLSIFKWSVFQHNAAGVKLHVLLDSKGSIPTFMRITNRSVADVNILDIIEFEQGAYYIMDRGYIDFERLDSIEESEAFFVVRAKNNLSFKRLYSNKVDKKTNIRCDQIIVLKRPQTRKEYPKKLRRIKYYDIESKRYFVYLTNDMNIQAEQVAKLYKHRWQIELFFKWIKQHLKIKSFWGESRNAIKIQIYTAICTYLIILIMKKRLKIEKGTYEILQILNISLLDKTQLSELLSEDRIQNKVSIASEQLLLLDS